VDNTHDKSFFGTFVLVMGGLFGIFFVIIVIAKMLAGTDGEDPKVVAQLLEQRTAPIGQVVTDPALLLKKAADTAAHAPMTGEQVVAKVCSACHEAGMLGAPKIGDKADWSKRKSAAGGVDGLVKVALAGKNQMPPRGGNPDLSDAEIKAAIQYMLGKAGL
jgi:cytochrome c5